MPRTQDIQSESGRFTGFLFHRIQPQFFSLNILGFRHCMMTSKYLFDWAKPRL